MKIILSRKGFDLRYGEIPSPIFQDNSMLSLPIPSTDELEYDDITYNGKTYGSIIESLKKYKMGNCHLDPDLRPEAKLRKSGWRPVLGQAGSAQGHLDHQKVGVGDIFLFYGWFQHAVFEGDKIVYTETGNGFHAIFGYLQVGEIVRLSEGAKAKDCFADHPHVRAMYNKEMNLRNNTLYIATKKLSLDPKMPGGGPLKFHDALVLTKKGEPLAHWDLPRFFNGISYHTEKSWSNGFFKATEKEQEFVVDASPAIKKWVKEKIANNG